MKNDENLQNFGKILRQRRQELALTLDQLAAITHISKPYLSNIETGRAPGPASDEKLTRLETALNFPTGELVQQAAWLRTPASVRALLPRDPPRRADGTVNLDAVLKWKGEGQEENGGGVMPVQNVPLINRVAAGKATEYTDLDYPVGIADQYVPLPTSAPEIGQAGEFPATTFALRVEGDSMLPDYRPGDIVVVSTREPLPGDDCLVRLDASENFATTLKRIFYEPAQGTATSLRLVPLNPRHAQRLVNLENVTGIYPVIWRLCPITPAKPSP